MANFAAIRQFFLALLFAVFAVAVATPYAFAQSAPTVNAVGDADDLVLELPPTTIVFDFYVADERRGEALVPYTNNWARFHDPEGVLEMLPEVKDKKAVYNLLNHGKILGLRRLHEGVGKIVINPDSFQAFLDLEPQVLDAQLANRASDDVEPDARPSLLNSFSVVTTNNLEGEGFDSTFFHRNSLVRGRDRLLWEGDYSDTDDYNIRNLLYGHEEDDRIYRAGFAQTQGTQFARGQEVMGVSVGSNIDTIYDNLQDRGDVVTIFVPSRARVRVFAEGRIIYTDILDFGLQQLDTTSFPSGSYDIVIEIREDSSGRVTTENQFFTKTTRLVPFGKPDWRAQIGFARDGIDPNTNEPIWEAYYRGRVASNLELGAAFLGGKDLNIFEPQFRTFMRDVELRGSLSFTDHGDIGAFLSTQIITDNFGTLTAQMRKTLAGHNQSPAATRSDEFNPLVGETEQFTAAWVKAFGRLQLTLRGTSNSNGGGSVVSYGATARYPLISGLTHRLDVQADYTSSNQVGDSYGAFLNYTYTPQNSYLTVANTTSQQHSDTGNASRTTTQVSYDTRVSSRSPGVEAVLTNTLSRDAGENFVGNDLQLTKTGRNFETRFTGIHNDRDGDVTGSIGLTARTTFALDGGSSTLVGAALSEATVIVDITGSAKGEVMVIKSGHQILGRGRVGEKISLAVQPFQTYNLTLEPENEEALVSYENTPRTFKLINGDFKIVHFDVTKIILVFGRLLDGEGNPLAWQRIKGASTSTLTDQFGNFQTEIAAQDVMHVENRQKTCTAAVPQIDVEGVFSYVGDILCL